MTYEFKTREIELGTSNLDDFAPVPIAKINPDQKLPTDVYIQIADKIIKFKEQDDEIPVDKYHFLISKNLKSFFIAKAQIPEFMEWLKSTKDESINEMVEDVGEENRPLVEKREEIKERVYETFSDQELTSVLVTSLQEDVEEFVSLISKKKESRTAIAQLTKKNLSLADHSVNVANLAIYIGMSLGYGHQLVLENIYMGGIFHDYGKAKIPVKVLENPNNAQYSQAIQDHPVKGATMLQKVKSIPSQVITIVQQHHEQHNGKGYPIGIKGEKMYDLAKIVAIADIFDHALIDNKNLSKKEMYRKAIKVLEFDKGKRIDPEFIPRVCDAFRLAYAGYRRD